MIKKIFAHLGLPTEVVLKETRKGSRRPNSLPANMGLFSRARSIGSEFKHFARLGSGKTIAPGPCQTLESDQ